MGGHQSGKWVGRMQVGSGKREVGRGGFCGRGSVFYDHHSILRQEPQDNPVRAGFFISTTTFRGGRGLPCHCEERSVEALA